MLSFLESCPLCTANLTRYDNKTFITYRCESCAYDGMPKFMANVTEDDTLLNTVWWLDDYYIQTDFVDGQTKISKIEVCMLFDPIWWPSGILEVDPKDPFKTARRLDVIMMFS